MGDETKAGAGADAFWVEKQTIVSTESRDSYDDIVRSKGCIATRWQKNPVILLQHGWAQGQPFPVLGTGRNLRRVTLADGLLGLAMDKCYSVDDLGRRVAEMRRRREMIANSIGFFPLNRESMRIIDAEGKPVEDNDKARKAMERMWQNLVKMRGIIRKVWPPDGSDPRFVVVKASDDRDEALEKDYWGEEGWGIEFLKWVLLESSVVATPANEDACGTMDELKKQLGTSDYQAASLRLGRSAMVGRDGAPSAVLCSTFVRHRRGCVLPRCDGACDLVEEALFDLGGTGGVEGDVPEADHVVKVLAFSDAPRAPEDTPWDQAAELAKATTTKQLDAMCALVERESKDGATTERHRFPYREASGQQRLVLNGVRWAMGVLLGSQEQADQVSAEHRQAVYDVLAKGYAAFNRQPPALRSYQYSELRRLFPAQYATVDEAAVFMREVSLEDCPACEATAPYHRPTSRFLQHPVSDGTACGNRGRSLERPTGMTLKELSDVVRAGFLRETLHEQLLARGVTTLPIADAVVQMRTRAAGIKRQVDAIVELAGAVLNAENKTKIIRAIGQLDEVHACEQACREALQGVLDSATPKDESTTSGVSDSESATEALSAMLVRLSSDPVIEAIENLAARQ